jgi:hypothetical protein
MRATLLVALREFLLTTVIEPSGILLILARAAIPQALLFALRPSLIVRVRGRGFRRRAALGR